MVGGRLADRFSILNRRDHANKPRQSPLEIIPSR